MALKQIYKVIFFNQGQVYEIYARQVSQGGLFGFIEVEELTFGERSQVLVDPSEERLKSEFAGVKRSYIPMHSVIRIDEVEKEGASKISEPSGNVTPFPMPMYNPSKGGD
ncbi:hypothetical protein CAI21_12825 [Alkalilimnicola ehrlichii]|uniref:DUF1820 domain-containing protein n=1 Tax=Alkalilimnicola ehrlichii TaxID=351052 RepID=A0A3E0WQX5_9GAMM|nr:DUF1820 family protein [Alkalilimnicola ehrlichii]RFA28212.1 hypothetical protein CAI21_12825 [Alkalilimnicola ehrlichii]RFA34809.1 hypothetical protein CAL65_13960 [Alkalilimnicola ehrlichii]